jgi:hypothetical protein
MKKNIILKGHLKKKNKFGNKQLRFFELYDNGELRYYKDCSIYKGTLVVGPRSNVHISGKN